MPRSFASFLLIATMLTSVSVFVFPFSSRAFSSNEVAMRAPSFDYTVPVLPPEIVKKSASLMRSISQPVAIYPRKTQVLFSTAISADTSWLPMVPIPNSKSRDALLDLAGNIFISAPVQVVAGILDSFSVNIFRLLTPFDHELLGLSSAPLPISHPINPSPAPMPSSAPFPQNPISQITRITERVLQPITQITKETRVETETRTIDDGRYNTLMNLISLIGDRQSGTQTLTAQNTSSIALTNRINQLNEPTINNGLTLASGSIGIIKGSIILDSGNITISSGSLTVPSLNVSGTISSQSGTTTLTDLTATNATISGLLSVTSSATSTFTGGLQANTLNIISTTASSTFANGIQLTSGCFRDSTGSCIITGGSGGSGTVNSGTANRLAYYPASSNAVSSANFLTVDSSNNFLGIGTTTPGTLFSIQGAANFSNTASSTIYGTTTTGNLIATTTIGIGTTTPGSVLSVQGNAQITGTTTSSALIATSTLFVGAQGQLFNVMQNGNVGIGTTSPSALLSVAGNVYVAGAYGFGYGAATSSNVLLDTNLLQLGSSSAASLTINYTRNATSTIPNNSIYAWSIATSTFATPLLTFNTTSNNYATTTLNTGVTVDGGALEYDQSTGITSVDSLNIGAFNFDTDAGIVSWADMPIATTTSQVIDSYTASIAGIPILTVSAITDGNGSVSTTTIGIGTTTPVFLLEIASTSPFFGITDTDAGTNRKHWTISNQEGNMYFATTSDTGNYATSTNAALTILSTSWVGIGTSTPGTMLSVAGASGILTEGPITVWNGATQRDIIARNGAICSDNNGTAKCQASLTAGTVYGDASSFGASDVAENYPVADDSIEAGDIVSMGTVTTPSQEHDLSALYNKIATSTASTQQESLLTSAALIKADKTNNRIIGIISTQPGVLLGDTTGLMLNTKTRPVALSGRVPVKVSLENGPIAIGDTISSSMVAGVGKKSASGEPVVGIALERFDGSASQGKILVFVNLGYSKMDPAIASGEAADVNRIWAIDSSGRVSAHITSGFDLSGNNILNVAKIVSANGTWSINENGKLTVKEIETGKLNVKESINVGSSEKPTGITLYDPEGNLYCIRLQIGGVLASIPGACGSSITTSSQATPSPGPNPSGTPSTSAALTPTESLSPSPSNSPTAETNASPTSPALSPLLSP